MTRPTTTKDALIAEIFTHVIKLDDAIKELPTTLQESLDPTAQRLEDASQALIKGVDQLIKAGNDHQARISEYVEKIAVPQVNDTAVQAIKQVEQAARALAQAPAATAPPPAPKKNIQRDVLTTITMCVVCMACGVALGWWLFRT